MLGMMYIYDLNVMILYLFGLNYEWLIYCYQGWDFCFIDVDGYVMKDFFVQSDCCQFYRFFS